jgi:cell division protein FtsN
MDETERISVEKSVFKTFVNYGGHK